MKHCKFLEDIYDDDKLIWQKDQDYLVTSEYDKCYIFGEHIKNDRGGCYAIGKGEEGKLFVVIDKSEEDHCMSCNHRYVCESQFEYHCKNNDYVHYSQDFRK
jgi:hypothetical protein